MEYFVTFTDKNMNTVKSLNIFTERGLNFIETTAHSSAHNGTVYFMCSIIFALTTIQI